VIHHDAYYRDFGHLPPEDRARINFDHPQALETALMVKHLQDLLAGREVEVPIYDFSTHTRSSRTRSLPPARVLIVDGILVLAEAELRPLMDVRIFVDTDADIRFIRRLRRDLDERGRTMDAVIRQYQETVRPMHLEFVEPSRRFADVIIPEGGNNLVAIDMVVGLLERALSQEEGPARSRGPGRRGAASSHPPSSPPGA
jgi:uridine kinase